MSDVPVTAWWLLSLWGAAAGLPAVAGLGAAAAVLTRPNLAPLAALAMAAVLVHAYVSTPGCLDRAAAAIVYALPLAAAAAFLGWLNTRLYGSPFLSGYGTGRRAVRRRQRPAQRRPLPAMAARHADARRPARSRGSVHGLDPASAGPWVPSSAPGWLRPRVRGAGRGVLPAVLALRGVVVLAFPPPGPAGPADPRVLGPGPARAGNASRRPRAAARGRRGASRLALRRHSQRAQRLRPAIAWRAGTWRPAPSRRASCHGTPSC